ncbi:MAG: ATP-binding protein [Vulcanimicrobiota bacterium]
MVRSLTGWAALSVLLAVSAKLGHIADALSVPTFCLMAAVLITDLWLLSTPDRLILSRSSQGLALAGALLSPGTGCWTIGAYLLGTLLLSTGRGWGQDTGICAAPLALTALLCSQFPATPITLFGATQLFLFLTLTFQPEDPGLKTSFFTELGGPGLAVAALALVQYEPLLLILLVPVAVGLSKAGDKNLSLFRQMRGALNRSRERIRKGSEALHESKKKLTQSETLLRASNELASTLAAPELRRIAGKYLGALGFSRYKYVEAPPASTENVLSYPLGDSLGFLLLEKTGDPDQNRGAQVLVRLLAVNLQNAKLHSQIVEAMERLKRSQAQLVSQNQLAAVGRLAAGMAHEVNTPLGAIKLSVESALTSLSGDPEKARPKLERALKAVEKAGRSVERLLYYSKPSGSQPPSRFQPQGILNDCLELLDHRFKRHRVQLDAQVQSTAELYGVEHDFYEMLSNLLLNASEAVEHDGERKVSVSLQESDSEVVLRVEDSGPGVAKELESRIFESFFTTKGSGRGTGLGLHLVQEVATRFGGRVEVGASPALGGAAFTVRLPKEGRN